MFCPRCSTENNTEQKFCRQCGLPLRSVRLALQSRVDEAIQKYKKGQEKILAGLVTLAVFFLLGAGNLAFGSLLGFAINMMIGIVIALPILIKGFKSFKGVDRLLEIEETYSPPAIDRAAQAQLPAAPDTDRSLATPPPPGSVTEHTTFDLKKPEKISFQPSDKNN